MNRDYCEKEEWVVAAVRDGIPDAEILLHARNCPVCSEVLLITELLREESNLAGHELGTLPGAGLIWRKAQAATRQKAIAEATLPIRLVRTCAYVAAILSAAWLVFQSFQLSPERASSWPRLLVDKVWATASNEAALTAGMAGTLICIAVSSWYILREE
ncbi:MAG TPA: hypothetical protein VIW68_13235 [Candidatus Sulfotelmatobacter sp.]